MFYSSQKTLTLWFRRENLKIHDLLYFIMSRTLAYLPLNVPLVEQNWLHNFMLVHGGSPRMCFLIACPRTIETSIFCLMSAFSLPLFLQEHVSVFFFFFFPSKGPQLCHQNLRSIHTKQGPIQSEKHLNYIFQNILFLSVSFS